MTPQEEAFLLLTADFSDPFRRCLTAQQLARLGTVFTPGKGLPADKRLEFNDLLALGCPAELAKQAFSLLSDRRAMDAYLPRGARKGCFPLPRVNRFYPRQFLQNLGSDAPLNLWYKGDLTLLRRPAVALVGNRDLSRDSMVFAEKVGALAARQGYVLISGNARGADTVAQESCLAAGGWVISIVADTLLDKPPRPNMLHISEEGYDRSFSAQRALSRNRLIHALAGCTFVAQCEQTRGGTWSGTVRNLRNRWSPVICHYDGSEGAKALYRQGATMLSIVELDNFFEERIYKIGHFDISFRI